MPLFGKKQSASTPALPVEQVKASLLRLNRPSAPYQIREGAAEGVDLVAGISSVLVKMGEAFSERTRSMSFSWRS